MFILLLAPFELISNFIASLYRQLYPHTYSYPYARLWNITSHFVMWWFWGYLRYVWYVGSSEGIIFPYSLGCLYMLGYELSVHKIVPFDVFISICYKKKEIEKKGKK